MLPSASSSYMPHPVPAKGPAGGRNSLSIPVATSISSNDSQLESRMRLTAKLWQAGISADLMYDDGAREKSIEAHLETCLREGVL